MDGFYDIEQCLFYPLDAIHFNTLINCSSTKSDILCSYVTGPPGWDSGL